MRISSFLLFFDQYNCGLNQLVSDSQDLQMRLLRGGARYSQLSMYGTDVTRILTTASQIKTINEYISSSNVVNTNLQTYTQSLDSIRDAITHAQQYISSHLPFTSDPKDPHTLQPNDIKKTIDNFLKQIQDALNQKAVDGSYLFAGQHLNPTSPPPVRDLTQLLLFTKDDLDFHFQTVKDPQLPYITYENRSTTPPTYQYATYSNYSNMIPFKPGTLDPTSWKQRSSTISAENTLQYGITSNSPAFQNAIDGLLALKSLANLVPNTKNMNRMNNRANQELSKALAQIQDLKGKIAQFSDQNTYAQSANTYAYKNFTNILQELSSDDTTRMTVQLVQLKQGIQAMHKLSKVFFDEINNTWKSINE